jgi:dienelactone hydrolase
LVAQAVARRERAFIKVYPGAHHSFDNLRVPTTYLHDVFNPHSPTGRGATVGGNRAARDAARVDLLAFLKTQL